MTKLNKNILEICEFLDIQNEQKDFIVSCVELGLDLRTLTQSIIRTEFKNKASLIDNLKRILHLVSDCDVVIVNKYDLLSMKVVDGKIISIDTVNTNEKESK